jgi:hypothetical protein
LAVSERLHSPGEVYISGSKPDDLVPLVKEVARGGERFFRMDVKPPYPDTPEDWEDRLEAAFSGLIR